MYTFPIPRPSQQAEILEAALSTFAERGYDGARIREIADRAGVTDGALYRHFNSKEELAQHLFAQALTAYSEALIEASAIGGSVRARLRGCMDAGLRLFRKNPEAMTFTLLRQHSFMPALPAGFRYPIQVIEGVITDGQLEGTVRAGDPKLLAAIFAGCLLRPMIVSQLAAPGSFDLIRERRHDETIIEAGWSAVAAPGRGEAR